MPNYARHKLHVDQNKKSKMFGVTHVAAVDGLSGMIVEFFLTMLVKNNIEIYSNLYKHFENNALSLCRPIVAQYGLWDQI